MDDDNDIRMTLGANATALRILQAEMAEVHTKLDGIAETLGRLAPLAEFLGDVRQVVEVDLPETLDRLAADPMLGALIGPYVGMLKGTLTSGLDRAATDRRTVAGAIAGG